MARNREKDEILTTSRRYEHPAIVRFQQYDPEQTARAYGDLSSVRLSQGREPSIHPYLHVVVFPEFDSYVEIRLSLSWTDGHDANKLHEAEVSIMFNAAVIGTLGGPGFITATELTPDNLHATAKAYGTTKELILASWGRAVDMGDSLWEVRIPHCSCPYTANLFVHGRRYGHEDAIRAIRHSVGWDLGEVAVVIAQTEDLGTIVSTFNDSIREIRRRSPLLKWHHPRTSPSRPFIDPGHLRPREERPAVDTGLYLSFPSWFVYLTVVGYAAVEESELQKDFNDETKALVRLLGIPRAGNRRYMMFLKVDDEKYRLSSGDVLDVDMVSGHDRFRFFDTWHAEVIDPSPAARMNEYTAILTRPFDEEEEEYCNLDLGFVEDFGKASTTADAQQLVEKAKERKVMFKRKILDVVLERQLTALLKLTKGQFAENPSLSWQRQALLAHRIDELPVFGIYSNYNFQGRVEHTFNLATADMNDGQRAAAKMCMELPFGIGLVQGPPGTGKTYWITHMVLPVIAHSDCAKDGAHHPVLAFSASNDAVDDLARRMVEDADAFMAQVGSDKKPVVIRLHAISSETEALGHRAKRSSRNARPSTLPQDKGVDLSAFVAAEAMMADYRAATHRPHGVNDKRVKLIELSLSTWMYKFSGLEETPWARKDCPEHAEFRKLYRAHRDASGQLSDDAKAALGRAVVGLRSAVLGAADVVVTTLSNAACPVLFEAVASPSMMLVDEAARAPEPDIWALLAHYPAGPRILVGDMKQLTPVVHRANRFRAQLSTSPMDRLARAGYPLTMLTQQRRMHSAICAVPSSVYYAGRLTTAPGVDARRLAPIFRAYVRDTWGIAGPASGDGGGSNAVLLDTSGASHAGRNAAKSVYNEAHVRVVAAVVRDLVGLPGVAPRDIAVLTPYRAQQALHRRALAQLAADLRFSPAVRSDMRGVSVETFDGFQGREATFVVADLPNTDNPGFLKEGEGCGRVNVGLSRARDGMVVVANTQGMLRDWRDQGTHLSKVFSVLKKSKSAKAIKE